MATRQTASKKKASSKKKPASKKKAASRRKTTASNPRRPRKRAPATKPDEPKRKMGRPTKFDEGITDRLLSFFNVSDAYTAFKDEKGNTVIKPTRFPTMARFAANELLTRQTLWEWSVEKDGNGDLRHPEFSYAYQLAKEFQEALLVEGTLSGAYQQAFSIFTAKNVLGWRDQKDLQHSGGIKAVFGFDLGPEDEEEDEV